MLEVNIHIIFIAGQAEIEWKCAMCSNDTGTIFPLVDPSIPDDEPTLQAAESTWHDSLAKKCPAAFNTSHWSASRDLNQPRL